MDADSSRVALSQLSSLREKRDTFFQIQSVEMCGKGSE